MFLRVRGRGGVMGGIGNSKGRPMVWETQPGASFSEFPPPPADKRVALGPNASCHLISSTTDHSNDSGMGISTGDRRIDDGAAVSTSRVSTTGWAY